jgi:hypothetical protein
MIWIADVACLKMNLTRQLILNDMFSDSPALLDLTLLLFVLDRYTHGGKVLFCEPFGRRLEAPRVKETDYILVLVGESLASVVCGLFFLFLHLLCADFLFLCTKGSILLMRVLLFHGISLAINQDRLALLNKILVDPALV